MPSKAEATDPGVVDSLTRISRLATAGFAIPLHFRFQTPAYMFQTYPSDWVERYSRQGLVMHDPVVRWSLANVGVVTWGELAADDPAGVMALAREHGMAFGLSVSLDRNGGRSLASLARADRDLSPDEVAEAVAQTERLHDLTESAAPLSSTTRAELRRMSIAFTHP